MRRDRRASAPGHRPLSAEEGRALVGRALPDSVKDRAGWSTDIYAAFASLDIAPTPDNVCAAVAVIAQESSFQVDPAVPGLAAHRAQGDRQAARERRHPEARARRRARAAVVERQELRRAPRRGEDGAAAERAVRGLHRARAVRQVVSGRSQSGAHRRSDAGQHRVRRDLRGGEPLPVSRRRQHSPRGVHAPRRRVLRHRAPARLSRSLHRGSSIASPTSTPGTTRAATRRSRTRSRRHRAYRSSSTAICLRYESGQPAREPGSTELATRVLARRIDMDNAGHSPRSRARERGGLRARRGLYVRVFALADRRSGKPVPRAVVPRIPLNSPKITRKLTTEWFAGRVDSRYRDCLRRVAN